MRSPWLAARLPESCSGGCVSREEYSREPSSTLNSHQSTIGLRKLLKPRARSALRGMINHLLPIEVEVVL